VIHSFGDDATEDLFHGRPTRRIRGLHPDLRRAALRKLDMLNAADRLEDLRSPPGNRLEALVGDRKGSWSIRATGQWRIVFRWTPNGPEDVALVDYH
jgi:addiction module HigA family antidote